jgi:ABC-type branched-subunit amino acid transport system ATPase component
MAWFSRRPAPRATRPILQVEGLDVYYGRAHALQEVSLTLDHGVIAVVGRNGMGKTTLCNAVTGLVPAAGSVRLAGEEILGLPPPSSPSGASATCPRAAGVALTQRGRASAPRLAGTRGPWTVARVYQTFPILPSAAPAAVRSSRAASRCWPSRGRCSSIPCCS